MHAQEALYLAPVELQSLREHLFPIALHYSFELYQRLDPGELKCLEQPLLSHHDGQAVI